MELTQLSNRVYYYPHNHEVDRPLLGYIKGDKYSLMIDAGTSSNHVQEFYNAVLEKGLIKPHFTAITHWHWDHTFGMHAIEGITIANVRTNKKLKSLVTTLESLEFNHCLLGHAYPLEKQTILDYLHSLY